MPGDLCHPIGRHVKAVGVELTGLVWPDDRQVAHELLPTDVDAHPDEGRTAVATKRILVSVPDVEVLACGP